MGQDEHFPLLLPSGRQAIVRNYSAAAADAIGDDALIKSGDALLKTANVLLESINDEPVPNWNRERKKAMQYMNTMLAGDIMHTVFMSCARYHEGVYEGDIVLDDGSKIFEPIPLLDSDGMPLNDFDPPQYPLGDEKAHEWTETSPDGAEVNFKFTLLNGLALRQLHRDGVKNPNEELLCRQPMWYRQQQSMMVKYDPKQNPPNWVANAISEKIKEIDPVIQYGCDVYHRSRYHRIIVMGQPVFFLQGFV